MSQTTNDLVVDAILFDMDGTLVDSTRATDETFKQFVKKHNLDLSGHPHASFRTASHVQPPANSQGKGIRMVDSMKLWFPEASEAERADMAKQFEADIIDVAQDFVKQGKAGIRLLPGVERLLSEIRSHSTAESSYAICTSASRIFASSALSTAGIVPPTHLLTADDCTHGKPHPEPYLKGAGLVQKDITKCLVIEDAPAGIKSGVAAGAAVIAVCTSHAREQVEGLGAKFVVNDLEQVHVSWRDDGKMVVSVTA